MSFFDGTIPVAVAPSAIHHVYANPGEIRQGFIELLLLCEAQGITLNQVLPEAFAPNGADAGEAMRRFIRDVLATSQPVMEIDCYALAYGIGDRLGTTLETVAKRHGVTRQHIHKRCNRIRSDNGLQGGWNAKVKRDKYASRNWGHESKRKVTLMPPL